MSLRRWRGMGGARAGEAFLGTAICYYLCGIRRGVMIKNVLLQIGVCCALIPSLYAIMCAIAERYRR